MQFPDDDNGQLLAEIAAAGVDLSKMHQIDFFILFEQQADAEKFANRFQLMSFNSIYRGNENLEN